MLLRLCLTPPVGTRSLPFKPFALHIFCNIPRRSNFGSFSPRLRLAWDPSIWGTAAGTAVRTNIWKYPSHPSFHLNGTSSSFNPSNTCFMVESDMRIGGSDLLPVLLWVPINTTTLEWALQAAYMEVLQEHIRCPLYHQFNVLSNFSPENLSQSFKRGWFYKLRVQPTY